MRGAAAHSAEAQFAPSFSTCRAIAFEKTRRRPPPPTWGRIEVGEANDDCLAPKRGFPLPNPHPALGEGILSERLAYVISLPLGKGSHRAPSVAIAPASFKPL